MVRLLDVVFEDSRTTRIIYYAPGYPQEKSRQKILLLGKSPLEGVLLLLKINLSTETHLELVSSIVLNFILGINEEHQNR